jgi:hypothetical protein
MAARTLRLVVVLLLILSSATCGGVPTSPSRSEYIGTWVGSMTHPTAGVGALTVTIDEGGDGVFDTGTWSSVFPDTSYSDRGTVLVPIESQTLGRAGFFLRTSRTCQDTSGRASIIDFIVTATIVNDRMTGRFEEDGCTLPFAQGTVDLRRR